MCSDEERKSYACIPYIKEVAPQLKRILGKAGINTVFKAGPKLKDFLCHKNRTRPDPSRKKGIYKHTCPCSNNATYVGQTGRSYCLRWEENKRAVEKEQWSHSGVTQHHQHCSLPVSLDNFAPVHNMQGKRRQKLAYDLRIREAIEIRKHDCGPGRGLNEDMGAFVKTDIWDPVLRII